MHTHTLKYFRSLVFTSLFCLAAVLIFTSCSKKPQQAIIGKWNSKDQASTMEFRRDGTVLSTENGKTQTNKYNFVDDSHMEIELAAEVGTNDLRLRLKFETVIKDDNADLTVTLPGPGNGPLQSQTIHLVRAK